jgi:Flp pilus assembly protein CpaB
MTGDSLNRRIIGLLLAIVLAGIATFFLIQFVTSADERAREAEALAEVFVAQGDIPAGTAAGDAIGQGLIVRDEIPARSVPVGAIGDLDQLSGLVAVAPVYDGEIIVVQRFGETVAQPTGVFEVPEGFQAVSIEAAIVPGVAGFVQAQDRVSVVASLVVDADADDPDDDEAAAEVAQGTRTQFLLQNVTVLAVGQRVVTTGEDGETTRTVQESNEGYIFTLALTPDDIEKLVFSQQEGQLWFTLLPQLEEDEEPEVFDTPGRTIENVFD